VLSGGPCSLNERAGVAGRTQEGSSTFRRDDAGGGGDGRATPRPGTAPGLTRVRVGTVRHVHAGFRAGEARTIERKIRCSPRPRSPRTLRDTIVRMSPDTPSSGRSSPWISRHGSRFPAGNDVTPFRCGPEAVVKSRSTSAAGPAGGGVTLHLASGGTSEVQSGGRAIAETSRRSSHERSLLPPRRRRWTQ
jgi:hypothetical protein